MEQEKPKASCERSPCCKCGVCLAVKAVLLLAIGGGLGFFAGRHCAMCRMQAPAAVAPQAK